MFQHTTISKKILLIDGKIINLSDIVFAEQDGKFVHLYVGSHFIKISHENPQEFIKTLFQHMGTGKPV